MTPRTSIKPTLLKMAAFTALAAGLTLPAAHAAPPTTAPKPTAQTPDADALQWDTIALQHTTLQAIIGSLRRGRAIPNPDGVKHLVYMMGKNVVLVHATPAGLAHMREIVRALDVAPRQVQLMVATATVSAAALNAADFRLDAVPLDGLVTAGGSLGMSTQAATGDAVAAYLAALAGRGAVSQVPVVATASGEQAYVDIPATPGFKDADLGVIASINSDGSITLRLDPTLSRLVAGRTNPDGTPAVMVRTFQTARTVRSGNTLVLANPLLPAAGLGGRYLLLFVTPTVVAGPDPAR